MENRLIHIALLIAAIVAPFLVYEVFLMHLLAFALFAAAYNLLLGYGGMFSLGHAAFFGLAAYTMGHALKAWELSPLISLALATGASTLLGLVMGIVSIRLQSIYFGMVTLALAQMVYFIFVQAPFTGGEDGLQGVPRRELLGIIDLSDNRTAYYFILALFVAGFWLVQRTIHSPFGHVIDAIRENENRAISLGYQVNRYKLLLFVISAGISGLAGAMNTMAFHLASLAQASWHLSGEVVLMTLIGGLGTVFGPIVGAGLVVLLTDFLSDSVFRALVPVVLGILFMVCVLFFRRGIVGEAQAYLDRRRSLARQHGGEQPAESATVNGKR